MSNPVISGERAVPGFSDPVTMAEHLARYEFALAFVASREVLDAACGVGYGSHMMAERAKKVVGVDIDPDCLEYARDNYAHPRVVYQQGDVCALPLPGGSFDVLVSFETIEHVADGEACVREAWRVLRPGGLYLVSTPNRLLISPGRGPQAPPVNSFHVREYTLEEFQELVGSYFQNLQLFRQNLEEEGRGRDPAVKPLLPGEGAWFYVIVGVKGAE
ncbi:ubiquinone/menaquinone biosynthesis C-methylase UbiE [Desulfofundulus luciae]|uniref:Ubiquinone/menaquinone biosynthesis C-methylase UbiE n=1 Tax=Desulfofundulus luciae TaxID=74702 RepID=A0ABU0AY57_9FIRM|nr:class I SAM-dependent methyltransferase [Desulfofundulus luciae]MDQ0284964.1 ubiquinone/menaquinone biosynthesis C-methylase UbiE [Desulfofundulus luciae]